MKYDLSASHVMSPSVEAFDPLQTVEMVNGLNEAYENLSDSIKGLSEVQAVMENIDHSLEVLSKYGQSAISQLNLDKGLEELLGIPEQMITAEKAVEGLGDAARSMWERFREWIKQVWTALKQLFKALIGQDAQITKEVEKVVEVIKENKVVVEKVIEKPVSNGVAEEEARVWEQLANEANAKLNESAAKVKELQAVVEALKSVKVDVQLDQSKLDAISGKIDSANGSVVSKLAAMIEAINDPSVKNQLAEIVKKLGTLDQSFRESNNKLKGLSDQAKEISQKVDQSRDSTLQNLGWTADKLSQHAEEVKKMIANMPKVQSLSDLVMNDVDRAAEKLGQEWDSVKTNVKAGAQAAANAATAAGARVKEEAIKAAQRVEAEAVQVAHRAGAAVAQARAKVVRPFRIAAAIASAMGEAAKTAYKEQTANNPQK